MRAIAAYMASRNNESRQGGNQNNYNEGRNNPGGNNRYGEMRRNEYNEAENRQSDRYNARNEMENERFEGNAEMRRRRDSRGRYMIREPVERYSEDPYRGRQNDPYIPERRSEDEEERPRNVVEFPYSPERMPPESRMIGFGTRNHYEEGRKEAEVGGKMWLQPIAKEGGMMMFDRETAEEWVKNMKNEDKSHPTGGKWSAESLKPLAQKYGIPTEDEKFWEFFAMTNAMYSDYSEVAKKFGITSPEFYACMAKAFMNDKDAEDDKVALYYEYIAKK